MKSLRTLYAQARRSKGLALIIVLSMLSLATIVMLAFLSVADTEHKGTMTYSSSQTARRLADTAVNLVVSQIRAGSDQDVNTPGREFHATQPGAVRKYTASGAFLAGYKLFSDAEMIFNGSGADTGNSAVTDEYNFVLRSEPPSEWNQQRNIARYVDMNEPVVKGVASSDGQINAVQTYFPIIDPRAGFTMNPSGGAPIPVEGFQFSTTTALSGSNLAAEDPVTRRPAIVQPPATGAGVDSLRLAMPVQWIYMLKDGSLGTLNSDLTFTAPGGVKATTSNPIVARLAFWADDETCKININTASEPTFQGRPTYFHERDHRWADYGAALGEYQRFPGHPATVALSSVFYPNSLLDTSRDLEVYPLGSPPRTSGSGAYSASLSVKSRIYQLAPRIHTGGSNVGTRLFAPDDFNAGGTEGLAAQVDLRDALKERLYASVDELLFGVGNTSTRLINDASIQGNGSSQLFTKQTLERASAFLTAHSRASEINMLGLPRIAMWPVHTDGTRRTGFDNLILFCSRLGDANGNAGNFYLFQRQNARSPTTDINLPRNTALLNMLDQILERAVFPSNTFTPGRGGNFKDKMLQASGFWNYKQLIVSMFDYIRSTNLHDSYLVADRSSWDPVPINYTNSARNLYDDRDRLLNTFKTYTPGVVRNSGARADDVFQDRALPGHGQVTPSRWVSQSLSYRGYGRSVSISEIGLQFICTADGQPDMYSWRHFEPTPSGNANQYRVTPVAMVQGSARSQFAQADMSQLEALAISGVVSGGRTALRINEALDNSFEVLHATPPGFTGGFQFTNTQFGDQFWRDQNIGVANQIKQRFYSNFPPLDANAVNSGSFYNVDVGPVTPANRGKHRDFHPGYDPRNWNHTLQENTPLNPTQKRIQALLHLEFFCPSVGYTQLVPEFTVVISGDALRNITVDDGERVQTPFQRSGDLVLKSSNPLYEIDGSPQVGGYASFRRVSRGMSLPPFGQMPADPDYSSDASARAHAGLVNLELASSFFTVEDRKPNGDPANLQFSLQNANGIRIDIYDTHDLQAVRGNPMQTIFFTIPNGTSPTPDLVVHPSTRKRWINSIGQEFIHPALQAPHWWAFHRGGALARSPGLQFSDMIPGRFNEPRSDRSSQNGFYNSGIIRSGLDGDSARNGNTGEDSVPGSTALMYGYENTTNYRDVLRHDNRGNQNDIRLSRASYSGSTGYNRLENHYGSDVVRSLQPGHGDPRIIYAKYVVAANEWSPHPLWDSDVAFLAHNFSSYNAGSEPGFDRSGDPVRNIQGQEDPLKRILPVSVNVSSGLMPDAPYSGMNDARVNAITNSLSPAFLLQRYYDFDDGDPGGRVGAYINKPDEGNYAVGQFQASTWPRPVMWRASYFRSDSFGARFGAPGRSFFTPNRMVSSPVMMGSLPSRVYFTNATATDPTFGGNGAWTNLLFRPHVQMNGGFARHPGQGNNNQPPDHYLLDLFWMPVVEPYAISEPLSSAGKVNMNYQMLPFTHIRRATALHAVMKGEVMTALPNVDFTAARGVRRGFGPGGSQAPAFRDESLQFADPAAKWHRGIAIDRLNNANGTADTPWWIYKAANQRVVGTLRQFEERFNFGADESGKGPSGIGTGGSGVNSGMPSGMRTGLFRSASQICEMHLIPTRVSVANNRPGTTLNVGGTTFTVPGANLDSFENINPSGLDSYRNRETSIQTFWNAHAATGDNTRESPYANLYAKLTTRSNTFRVHVRAQTVKKALRGDADAGWAVDKFIAGIDEVTGEYRGSFLLERYVDMADLANAGAAADFTTGNPLDEQAHPPLDSYYRFRVIESKRFAP